MRNLLLILCFIVYGSMVKAQLITVNNITYAVTDATNYYVSVGNGTPASQTLSGAFTIPTSITYNGITYSVTSIQTSSFSGLSGLTSITIPSTIKSIGMEAFYRCYGLSNITIPSSIQYIFDGAFQECTNLSSVTIPTSVTFIGDNVFNDCTKLSNISIPSSVTHIGNTAFFACNNLTSIHVKSTTPIDLTNSNSVFSGVFKSKCTLYIPKGSKTAYQSAAQWKDFTYIVEEDITTDIHNKELAPVYNPITKTLRLNGLATSAKVELYSVNGERIFSNIMTESNILQIPEQPKGAYLLRISSGDVTKTIKIVI